MGADKCGPGRLGPVESQADNMCESGEEMPESPHFTRLVPQICN